MLTTILFESEQDLFIREVLLYLFIGFICFIISVYIVRAIFDIPKIVRLHKAQVHLLEEIAKQQGVDGSKVQSIISETRGWNDVPTETASLNK